MKFDQKKVLIILGIIFLILLAVLLYLLFSREGNLFENEEEFYSELEYADEITDVDRNVYKTVRVGDMVWMAENLRTEPIHGESWCYSDQQSMCERFGRLYNWEAVMAGEEGAGSQGICPDGWYVPTDQDWYELESFFADSVCDGSRLSWGCFPAGRLMKTEDWGGEENKFNVLPAGFIDRQERSSLLNSYSYFWTSSKMGDGVWRRGFLDSQDNILRSTENPEYGYSVRCVEK